MAGCCLSPAACCIRPAGSVGHPVDVGWAWVMAAAASGIFGFQGAAFKLFGMVYVEMLDHFQSDPKVTLYVFSVSGMVTLLSGPLVSLFVQKTSNRCVVATGSLCMAAGVIGTGFAPTMAVAFFTWGVVYAFGVTCLLICGLTCTGPYFNKYRGLAVGIAASGNGVLSFILPNVLRALFDHYPFSSALLLFGGITLHVLILAMLVRSPSYYNKQRHTCLQTCCGFDVAACFACFTNKKRLPTVDGSAGGDARATEAVSSVGAVAPEIFELKAVMADSNGTIERLTKAAAIDEKRQYLEAGNATMASGDSAPSEDPTASTNLAAGDGQAATDSTKELMHSGKKAAAAAAGHQHRPSTSYAELLRNPLMWLIGLTMLFVANAVSIVFSVIPPYADSIGISRQSVSILLAVTGAFEIFCRGFHGWFSDRNVIPCLLQLGLCSGFTGLAAILCPIVGGQVGIGLLTAACGATGTSCFSLVPIVIRQLLGADKVTTGMGIQLFFQSSSFMLSTYMAGFLFGISGSWVPVFYYIGGNMLVACLLAGSYGTVLAVQQRRSVHLAKRDV